MPWIFCIYKSKPYPATVALCMAKICSFVVKFGGIFMNAFGVNDQCQHSNSVEEMLYNIYLTYSQNIIFPQHHWLIRRTLTAKQTLQTSQVSRFCNRKVKLLKSICQYDITDPYNDPFHSRKESRVWPVKISLIHWTVSWVRDQIYV